MILPLENGATARLRAYALMEAAQGEHHAQAGRDLVELEAEAARRGWADAAFLAAAGQALYAIVRGVEQDALEKQLAELVVRAESLAAPAMLALALAMRALAAVARGDTGQLLADAGRAVALVETEELPALDRCTVLVICAGAYNTLSLWELVDELYDRAAALEPLCEQPIQAPAIACSRVIIRLEWATALLEQDDDAGALIQLRRAADSAGLAASAPNMPALWELDVQASRDMLILLLGEGGEVDRQLTVLDAHRIALEAADDVEVLPLLKAMVALTLLRLGRDHEALAALAHVESPRSSSSGARSFPAWVRARVLGGSAPDEAVQAYAEYGVFVSRLRWDARQAVLAAARARIAFERLRVENVQLTRDATLDALTGLQNRRAFDAWLQRETLDERLAALLLLDLDDFKEVNDVHGHAVGDDVLRLVGNAIAHHVRVGDLAIRLGGDEFAVVLEDHPDTHADDSAMRRSAVVRARSLADAIGAVEWTAVAPGLVVRVSVGVAMARLVPGDAEAADRLYRQADAALYAAKSEGEQHEQH